MQKHFAESLGDFARRVKSGKVHKSLRTLVELCKELDVPVRTVMGKLKLVGAPKPKLRHSTTRGNASWFDPDEFKTWWAKQTIQPAKPPTRHCDECAYMYFSSDLPDQYECTKGHKPRWYAPKREGDTDYGYKRRCEDFEGEF